MISVSDFESVVSAFRKNEQRFLWEIYDKLSAEALVPQYAKKGKACIAIR